MEVKKIMTKNPACCTSDSTLQEVAHMMEMYDCGCIPVVEDHKTSRPIGTITDRDIAMRSLAENKNPLEMKASDIMTTDIATITPETTVEQCRDVMENRQIRRILVVDKNGGCVGIVAQADIVQHESNPRQTAEFIRDVSQPTHSAQSVISSERQSYQNFSNQNRSFERDFSTRENRDNQSFSRQERKVKKFRAREKSFFSSGSLLPLIIGVGAGAALKYLLPVDKKSQTTFVPRSRVTSSVHTNKETTPEVSIKLPTETHVHIKESREAAAGKVTSLTSDDDTNTNSEIGRTARL